MKSIKFPKILHSIVGIGLLALAVGGVLGQPHAPGGTVISNTARYTYADTAGNPHSNSSNTVTVTVAVISGIEVISKVGKITNLGVKSGIPS